jgi:hypothetical protein
MLVLRGKLLRMTAARSPQKKPSARVASSTRSKGVVKTAGKTSSRATSKSEKPAKANAPTSWAEARKLMRDVIKENKKALEKLARL